MHALAYSQLTYESIDWSDVTFHPITLPRSTQLVTSLLSRKLSSIQILLRMLRALRGYTTHRFLRKPVVFQSYDSFIVHCSSARLWLNSWHSGNIWKYVKHTWASPEGWHLQGRLHYLCPGDKTDRNLNKGSEMHSGPGYFLYSILNTESLPKKPRPPRVWALSRSSAIG